MFGLKMPKKLSKGSIILFVLAAAITGFTSLKTIDLLRFTMPPDQLMFAWVGWACFEGGLAAWIFFSGSGARRDQRTIASLMVWFNLLAVVVAFFADTILVVARKGGIRVDNTSLTWIVIIAVGIVVTVNLVAVVATHQADPDTKKRIKQEEYQEALEEAQEEAEHRIEIERLKYIAKNATAIAPHIGYQQGMDWTQQMYQRWALPGQPQPQLPSPARAEHRLPNGDEIAVYGPNQQIAQQHLNKEVQMFHSLDTSNLDTGKYMSLLDKAVQYGQISEEEASPLRQALGKTQAKHQSNGKQ